MNLTSIKTIGAVALWMLGSSVSTLAVAQSAASTNLAPPPPPHATTTVPPRPSGDMRAVLDALASLDPKPIEQLTPVMARIQPSAADATRTVMRARGLSTAPDPAVVTQDLAYGPDPMQYARIYKPAAPRGDGPMPVIVYYHGGGFVIADVNTYDAAPRLLSKQLGAIVVSVEYRHAPEFRFPAQHMDAAAAYRWVLHEAASWGGDPAKIAPAGESAGGNLAVATAIYARDNRLPMPVYVLSIYPIANSSKTLPSRIDSANAKPLDAAMLDWFGYYYTRTKANMMDPRLDLVHADLRRLPPTTIVNAQIDPLRSDGETLAQAMHAAGDTVEQRTFSGVTHEFFGMGKAAAMRAHLHVDPPMLMPAQAEMIAELRTETGPARDATYIAQQKAAHGQALSVQKAYAASGTVVPLKMAAGKTVPAVKMHIAMLMKM